MTNKFKISKKTADAIAFSSAIQSSLENGLHNLRDGMHVVHAMHMLETGDILNDVNINLVKMTINGEKPGPKTLKIMEDLNAIIESQKENYHAANARFDEAWNEAHKETGTEDKAKLNWRCNSKTQEIWEVEENEDGGPGMEAMLASLLGGARTPRR